jgi:hypothetical protein
VRAVIPQHRFLSCGRRQAVAGHSNIISGVNDIPEEVKRRFVPGLNAGARSPRSR